MGSQYTNRIIFNDTPQLKISNFNRLTKSFQSIKSTVQTVVVQPTSARQ